MDEPAHEITSCERTQRWTPVSSPTRGREPEDDSTAGDDLDRALRELLDHEQVAGSSGGVLNDVDVPEDLTLLAGWEVKQPKPPAVLCIRAVDFREPLVGRRARFWLTSFDESGDLIALGWRDGLRIVSEVQDLRGQVDRVVEPTVSVQDEADYYRALSGVKDTPRFAAGVSRIWVEEFVSQPDLADETVGDGDEIAPSSNAWLSDVVDDPGAPRIIRPVPARSVHALTGRRVIHVPGEGTIATDLRAVGEPSWTHDGTIIVPVTDEHDWYLWTMRSNNMRHPSLRAVEISSLWVEG
jgi:hypothetical protein